MLNKNNERELAYLVKVDAITPMNADRLECAHVGGWHCVVGKGEFKAGDVAVYFEIDSQLPDVEPFSSMDFLRSKNFKVKTQKIRGEYSQGLLVPVSAFGWQVNLNNNGCFDPVSDHETFCINDESKFLTKVLKVTYADPSDNLRKSSGPDKYKAMASRRPKIFRQKWARWLMRREWGRKLMFFFFGKKKDKKNSWPSWVVKTDEERIENCAYLLANDEAWIATEKIDGSSTTFTMRGSGRKRKFFVCSRNVVFDKPDKKCFYDTNIYTEMAEKYNMEEVMARIMMMKDIVFDKPLDFLTIQAETYGAGVQKRDYGLNGHDMAIFNIIFGYKDGTVERLNPFDGAALAKKYDLPYVPVLGAVEFGKTAEEVSVFADGESKIDGGMREGIVCRSFDGVRSFKAVSKEFLLKYHN